MIAEICVTELEEISGENEGAPNYTCGGIGMGLLGLPQPVVQESSHPYTDDVTLTGIFDAVALARPSLERIPRFCQVT